jgi:hypothetical protein
MNTTLLNSTANGGSRKGTDGEIRACVKDRIASLADAQAVADQQPA